MTTDDVIGPVRIRYPVGAIVKTIWSEAEWRVVDHEDGKEGAEARCVIVPVLGPERTLHLGYGAIRPVDRKPVR